MLRPPPCKPWPKTTGMTYSPTRWPLSVVMSASLLNYQNQNIGSIPRYIVNKREILLLYMVFCEETIIIVLKIGLYYLIIEQRTNYQCVVSGSREIQEEIGKRYLIYADPAGAIFISLYIAITWYITGRGMIFSVCIYEYHFF